MSRVVVVIGVVLFLVCIQGSVWAGDEVVLEADAEIQAKLRDFHNLKSEEVFYQKLKELKSLSGKNYAKLVPQLALYSMQPHHNVVEAMFAGVIIERLEISDTQILYAIAPYLCTQDKEMRDELEDYLGGTENRVRGRRPDYSTYGALIGRHRRSKLEPPYGLIAYMYREYPGAALLSLMRVYMLFRWDSKVNQSDPIAVQRDHKERQRYIKEHSAARKVILWADHVVSDVLWKQEWGFLGAEEVEAAAVAELEKLSRHEAWWVRLYVAEIFRQEPEFRDPKVVGQLKDDPHRLVREVIGSFVKTSVESELN